MKNNLFITLIFLFSIPSHSWEVSKLRGKAHVEREEEPSLLTLKQVLQVGDVIKTGRGARVLLIEDKSKLWLGPKTAFKLKASEVNQPTFLQILYGKMRTIVAPKQAKRYRYKFKTVVAGVRGTEFFAQSDATGDRLCTLEGEIEVETQQGDRVIIPAGKGVLFSSGEEPRVSKNSSFLVDRWVGETSIVGGKSSIQNFYEGRRKKHALGAQLFWGLTSWMTLCDLQNSDFKNSIADQNISCMNTYISPFLQYGQKHRLFLRPALNIFWSNQTTLYDHRPTSFGKQQETFTMAEAYIHSQFESFDFKLGYQEIQWNEGLLISSRKWSTEPMTYMALRSQVKLNEWKFDILAIDGGEKNYKLDGINQISMLGLKIDLPKLWGNLFVLYANYPGFDSPLAKAMHHERELTNIGFYRKAKVGKLDYKVSGIYQKHTKLTRINRVKDKGEGVFIDLEWGWNIPTKTPVRFSYRGIYASKDFASMQNDYYLLGISPLFRNPANISQMRIKFEWQFMDGQLLFLEYLNSDQVSNEGFIVHQATTEDNLHISDEIDLAYSGKISESLNSFFGLFIIFPGSKIGSDPSYGAMGRLEYNF